MARIKKIMQTDDEVGKISNGTTVLISSCVEQFLKHLCRETLKITSEKKAKAVTANHLKECIEQEELFDFLKDVVEDISQGPLCKKAKTSNSKKKEISEVGDEESESESESGTEQSNEEESRKNTINNNNNPTSLVPRKEQ